MAGAHHPPRSLGAEELLVHLDWMRRLARALVRDADQAEDLAQDGVEVALAHPPRVDRPVRPWLAGVLRNLARLRARGAARRARREAASTADAPAAPPQPPSPEELVERVETERMVAALVLGLAEPYRSTVLLRYHEGRTPAEIARLQGVPAGTVRWRLKEGLDQVRAQLDARSGGERARWRALLLPLATRRGEGGAATGAVVGPAAGWILQGALLMSTKTKVAAGLALLVVVLLGGARLGGFWPWPVGGRGEGAAGARGGGKARLAVSAAPLRLSAGPGGRAVTATADPEPPGGGRVYGRVVDGADAPVGGAVVAIDSSPPRMTVCDAQGAFAFTGLGARTYHLEAHGGELYAAPMAVRLGAAAGPVTLRALPGARVEVEVSAADRPVPAARVELRGTLVWRAETDGAGLALLAGVGPGFRPLRVEAPGLAPAAQMVETRPGAGTQKITVRLERGAAVSGRVVGPQGAPVAGARVWARSSSEPFPVVEPAFDAVTSDGEGAWRIEALAAGSYQFVAGHPDFAPAATPPVMVGAGRPPALVVVRLEGGGRLRGQVLDEQGRPVAAAQVRAATLTGMALWPDIREAFTDGGGRFQLDGLPRRALQVVALADDAASPVVPADLAASGEAEVTLTLSVRGRIAGIVVDGAGRPVAQAQVIAESAESGRAGTPGPWELRGLPTATADDGGRFRLVGLPAGHPFRVRAARPGAGLLAAHLQPETRARPGDENVWVVVRGDGTVVGRVQFEDGTAPGRFAVELERGAQTAFTAPDGAFALSAPAGIRDLTVTGPAFVTTRRPDVEVREGARSDVGVIRVARGRSITGRVFGAGGAPVAGALVVAGMQLSGGGRQLYIPSESRGAQETTSDDEGHYALAGFAPGPLVVVADREGEGRSATIPVPRGAASAQVDLVLRATGSLEGRITRDGRPFPDTVVIVSPQLGLSNFFVTSGPDGRYALDALAPGPQILLGFLNRHKDMTMRGVTIEAGRRAQADLAVRTGTLVLRARVQAVEDGTPIPPAQVVLLVSAGALEVRDGDTLASLRDRPPPETPTTIYRRAGRGGALEVDGLPPGSYTACVAVGPPPAPGARPGGMEMEAAPLRCARHELAASGEVVLSVPRGWAEAVAKR